MFDFLDEQLGARLGLAGLFNQGGNASDDGIPREPVDPDPQGAGAVDSAGEHLIAD
ncbi:Uncharacterised protein [Mycobacterium tuberculosis]|uniref:Uncharacterized protein n=1 Tax=Mycobacterium tuberculosis TaxID=1773 RepID=A0A655J8M5_MYCTX|nr:Uncharacterised protein [Mycobacterium tuberculosis]CKS83998.1 Uncharacterised protein [Mycobacterium tuberculosis]CKT01290.1 Uncharacterised protein [Mycobacterium tuberculosis]CNL54516.1 Uncharacterised protein [Mycobacterium tuberculosis]CNM24600.1 Uncharacterised protein [Mycobacterium tuberculosis]